MRLSKVR